MFETETGPKSSKRLMPLTRYTVFQKHLQRRVVTCLKVNYNIPRIFFKRWPFYVGMRRLENHETGPGLARARQVVNIYMYYMFLIDQAMFIDDEHENSK